MEISGIVKGEPDTDTLESQGDPKFEDVRYFFFFFFVLWLFRLFCEYEFAMILNVCVNLSIKIQ